MRHHVYISASVLPTIMVVSVLMLLGVLAIISFWESDILLFSRNNRIRNVRAHINSMYVLYETRPDLFQSDTTTYQLYDSVPDSELMVIRSQWGLYEIVKVSSTKCRLTQRRMVGLRRCDKDEYCFWYCNNNSVLTLTGNSNIQSTCYLPQNGVTYGQMRSIFFSGEKIDPKQIRCSEREMPKPSTEAVAVIDKIFDKIQTVGDTSIVVGDEVVLSASDYFEDVIIVANKIVVEDDFRGSVQCFARDSIIVNANVTLGYPSGLYSQRYITIGDNSCVNGYVIVESKGAVSQKKPNYIQSRLSRIRGFLYVDAVAQLQGIVTGTACIREASYFSPQGYYRHMVYDATILQCTDIAFPYFFLSQGKSRNVKQLK